MRTNLKLSEQSAIELAVAPQDVNTDRTSAWRQISDFRSLRAVAFSAALAEAGKKLTVQLLQATSSGGAGAKALTAVIEAVAGSPPEPMTVEAEAKIEQLDLAGGFTWVAVKVTSDNGTAVDGGAILELGGGRYRP